MKSIGISLKGYNSLDEYFVGDPIQLHLNLWKSFPFKRKNFSIKKWRKNKYPDPFYLDIGIMARFSTINIKVYLPFKCGEHNQWLDLAQVITEHPPILCALFNDDYRVNPHESNFTYVESSKKIFQSYNTQEKRSCKYGFCEILKKFKSYLYGNKEVKTNSINDNTPDDFYIYSLQDSDVSVKNYDSNDSAGTIFSIVVPNLLKCKDEDYYYIRFRVPIVDSYGLAYNTDMSNDWLQSAFTELDMYNLQINELRDIPDNPFYDMTSNNYNMAMFSKIHLLYISNPQVKVENGSRVKSDSRLIESKKWKPYIPIQYIPNISDAYMAHHWKISSKNDSCIYKSQLFFTAEFPEFHIKKVTPYILIVILLGAIGSVFATFLCGGSPPVVRNAMVIVISSAFFYSFWYLLSHVFITFI